MSCHVLINLFFRLSSSGSCSMFLVHRKLYFRRSTSHKSYTLLKLACLILLAMFRLIDFFLVLFQKINKKVILLNRHIPRQRHHSCIHLQCIHQGMDHIPPLRPFLCTYHYGNTLQERILVLPLLFRPDLELTIHI